MNTTSVTGRTEVFPLLMNFTHATPVEEWDGNEKVMYDEIKEIVYDARVIGTKSLRVKRTIVKQKVGQYGKSDGKANVIDDSKTVK